MEYYDTYYINSSKALKYALQNNRVLAPNKIVSALQICYYDGKKIENAPQNCIHVPFDTIVTYFSSTKYRIPKIIDTTDTFLEEQFYEKLTEIENILNQKKENLYREIQNLQLNFQDTKLRIFAYGCRETVLIKYFMENIIESAKNLGYEAYLHTQTNELEACSEVSYLEALRDFNPHVTININHFNNHFLNDTVFNFVWFQDLMPILTNDEKPFVRTRDSIFYLTEGLNYWMKIKNIQGKIQGFCIDTTIYKIYPQIKKKKKIIFIGTSHKIRLEWPKKHKNFEIIYNKLIKIFEKNSAIEIDENIETIALAEQYSISYDELGYILSYLERDYAIEKLCSINTEYEIEIYGRGWENNPIIAPFYKGVLEYGEDIAKIYNSATYGYCPGGYILMQRTLECACSGTIPLVLDVRERKQDDYNKKVEECMEFFHLNTLEEFLKKEPKTKTFDFIREAYSYKHMVKKFLDIVHQEIGK